MTKLTTSEIRKIWIEFFESKQHMFIPPKSLIPVNDPSLLWINSGVATLKDYFSGKLNPPSQRLVNIQKAIRTNDILNVGVTARHHTFFEMLGNFSIGDYFKEEAIEFGFELLTKKFNIPLDKLYFTVYQEDKVAIKKWVSLGVDPKRIVKGNKDRNFWDVGQGPCGPCTEIYFDRGEKYDPNHIGEKLMFEDIENDRYVEIWNIVFSQFNNDGKNNYTELARKNIDTGAGLERLACIFQDVPTNYDTDSFQYIIKELEKLSDKKYDMNAYFTNDHIQKQINHDYIVIADHIKANVFAVADGAIPSGKERGSVLRKLIRRAMVCARRLHISQSFIATTVDAIIHTSKDFYPYLVENRDKIIKVLTDEEALFNRTLDNGFALFSKAVNEKTFNAHTAFKLTETYGFPYEIVEELMSIHKLTIDKLEYEKKLKHHQEISKSKKDIKGMMQQNATLIEFKTPSNFDYHSLIMNDSKIVGLFDDDFNHVNELKDNGWIVFNNTPFYATSGGQVHDIGEIVIDDNKVMVDDVIKGPNGQHFHHVINNKIIKTNKTAGLFVDEHNRMLTTRNHSTEHILHKTLRELISDKIKQEGALKTSEKLTFDFACDHHLTQKELERIENKVNEYIKQSAHVRTLMCTYEQAKELGAIGHFDEVYKKIVGKLRVVDIEGITKDLCGGTHVSNTNQIEEFMITKFFTVGGGLYRIEAITSHETINKYLLTAVDKIKQQIALMSQTLQANKITNASFDHILNDVSYDTNLQNYHKLVACFNELTKIYNEEILKFNKQNTHTLIEEIRTKYESLDMSKIYLVNVFNDLDNKTLSSALTNLVNKYKNNVFIALNKIANKTQYIVMANKEFCNTNNFNANSLIKEFNNISNGSGGGRDTFAQGGSLDENTISKIIDLLNTK